MQKRLSKDKLANLDSTEVTHATMGLISHIQDQPPELQVASLAASFLLICQHLKLNPVDAFNYSARLMRFAEETNGRLEYKAIRAYLENET